MTSFLDGIDNAFDFNSHPNHKLEIDQYPMPYLEILLIGITIILIIIINCVFKCCSYRDLVQNVKNQHLTYYLQMRNPKCNLFYCICTSIVYIYLFSVLCIPHKRKLSISIAFSIITLLISFVSYTCYLLYFSHYQQQLIIGGLQQNNGLFERFGHMISYLMTQKKFYHENVCLSIMIGYNILFISLCILFKTLSLDLNIMYYTLFIMTPQIIILNVMIFLMIRSMISLVTNTSELSDIFHLWKQFKLTCYIVILPLDLVCIIIWALPRYSEIILMPFLLYSFTVFMYTISRYPVRVQLKQERRTAIKATQSETWQDFLCEQNAQERKTLFDNIFNNNDDIDQILDEIHSSFKNRTVSAHKLKLFLTQFAFDPSENTHSCLHEFLFVSEVMQIKTMIAKRKNNGLFTSQYGLIIEIPDGLPGSPILNLLISKEEITARDLYDAWCMIYERYIHDDSATIPLYNLQDIEVIHRVWDRLFIEYREKVCKDIGGQHHKDRDNGENIFDGIDLDFKIDPNRFINNDMDIDFGDIDIDIDIDTTEDHNVESIKETDDMYNYNKYSDNDHASMIDACLSKFNDVQQPQSQSPLTNSAPFHMALNIEYNVSMETEKEINYLLDDSSIYEMIGCFDELLKWTHSRIESEYNRYKEQQIQKIKKETAQCMNDIIM